MHWGWLLVSFWALCLSWVVGIIWWEIVLPERRQKKLTLTSPERDGLGYGAGFGPRVPSARPSHVTPWYQLPRNERERWATVVAEKTSQRGGK